MKKGMVAFISASLLLMTGWVQASDWNLAKNVRRLEQVAPDYKEDRPVDKKFLELLDLTEKTAKGDDIYADAKRIATMPALAQSKYVDSLQYYMLVKSITEEKGAAEQDYWLGLLRGNDKSPHLLAAWLVHMRQLPKGSPVLRNETQQLVNWIKARSPEMRVRAPEYTGNILMGHKPRVDFAEGDWPKAYKVSYYKASVTPPDGFLEDDAYVLMLDRLKGGNEDTLSEMAAIYKRAGKRKEASDALQQQAALKSRAQDLKGAKTLLDEAVRLNPDNTAAVKERDRIKLELTYQSLAPAQSQPPAPAPGQGAAAPALSQPAAPAAAPGGGASAPVQAAPVN